MMSQETVQNLIEKAEKSVSITGNQGVGPAMEWLSAHNDDKMGSSTSEGGSTSNTNSETGTSSETVAKSYKYEDCNKLFADTAPLEYHAMKSGHSDFVESTEEKKLLTEDEKKEQIKILEKREEREAKEKEEELEREKIRIRSGKEMAADNKKLENENMKKMDERKCEKQEEKVVHDEVKVQIEADKSIRGSLYAQFSAEDRLKYILPVAIKTVDAKKQKKIYTETKLQIRLTNGQTIVQTFNVNEMMDAVKVYIELNRSDGDAPYCLMTSFPRKIFTRDDYKKSLDELGLVPSAVLILTKPQE